MPDVLTPALYRKGEGEPLLLLHGFKGTWHQWVPVLDGLSGSYEVIAPTLPGHYGGPAFEKTGALRMDDAGDAVEELLDQLGVTRAHMVGNSMGGGLALELAKRGRALSVIALAPSGGWDPGGKESRRLARFFVRQRRLVKMGLPVLPVVMVAKMGRRLTMRDVMWRGERMTKSEAVDLVLFSSRCALEGRVIEALFAERAALEGLDQVRAPTLIAWPEKDRILPMRLHAGRFKSEIAGVEFVVLPGVGHVPMWDSPQLVIDTIRGFIGRHPASAPAPAPAPNAA